MIISNDWVKFIRDVFEIFFAVFSNMPNKYKKMQNESEIFLIIYGSRVIKVERKCAKYRKGSGSTAAPLLLSGFLLCELR